MRLMHYGYVAGAEAPEVCLTIQATSVELVAFLERLQLGQAESYHPDTGKLLEELTPISFELERHTRAETEALENVRPDEEIDS